ncbi:helix-turn-helix domain-containing protein [Streptomyces yerevanensis]|uniref:helix-turn-helix domain-containing protein n=1 Tax=Streptomyces yerevanensis TaxID=66378 RepID=UPI000527E7DB|nr:XRE family transcriptional regulator [Streptomyces yerevanensis]
MTGPTPSPERARLAAALRELKVRTGLSLAGLAERTAYSKSSWDRYLGGKALPPRQAVQDLCRLAREPDSRCLALWEIAESGWSGRATDGTDTGANAIPAPNPPPPPPPPPQEDRHTGHKRAVMAVLASVCAVAVGSVTVALLLLPRQDAEPRSSRSPSPASSAPGPRCRGNTCEGQNPSHMYCHDADTLATRRTATGAWMQLHYSEKCEASWARTWSTRIGDRLEMTAGGPVRSADITDDIDTESYVFTDMAATRPGTTVRACLLSGASGKKECVSASLEAQR